MAGAQAPTQMQMTYAVTVSYNRELPFTAAILLGSNERQATATHGLFPACCTQHDERIRLAVLLGASLSIVP